MSYKNILAAFLYLAASGASAAVCGASEATLREQVAPKLTGSWSVTNGAGMLSMAGRTMILPAGNNSTARITQTAEGMTISGGEIGPDSYPLTFVAEQKWRLDPNGDLHNLETQEALFGTEHKVEPLTRDELELLSNCPDGNIPQLYAMGEFQGEEGTVRFELFLFMTSDSHMYGVVKGNLLAMGATAKRVTLFTR